MESLLPVLEGVVLAVWLYVTCWFVVSLILKRNDVADVAWGPGIALVGIVSFMANPTPSLISFILTALGCVWALRLMLHIGIRNAKKSEDARYKKWRDEWGRWFVVRSYVQVFLLQGALMIVVGSIFIYASTLQVTSFSVWTVLGVAVWLYGFIFETVGDYQLVKFLNDPNNRGRIMTSGLWKYTRHPNYFGEVTQWWGLWFVAITSSFALWPMVSPLSITFLILGVSGIPMLEKMFEGNQEFEVYKNKTSAFFPFPPKNL